MFDFFLWKCHKMPCAETGLRPLISTSPFWWSSWVQPQAHSLDPQALSSSLETVFFTGHLPWKLYVITSNRVQKRFKIVNQCILYHSTLWIGKLLKPKYPPGKFFAGPWSRNMGHKWPQAIIIPGHRRNSHWRIPEKEWWGWPVCPMQLDNCTHCRKDWLFVGRKGSQILTFSLAKTGFSRQKVLKIFQGGPSCGVYKHPND